MGNTVRDNSTGIQIAGLYNASIESFDGLQISGLFNNTSGQLTGIQLSLINRAGSIKGQKSTPPTRDRDLQFGLLNFGG